MNAEWNKYDPKFRAGKCLMIATFRTMRVNTTANPVDEHNVRLCRILDHRDQECHYFFFVFSTKDFIPSF